MPQIAERFEMLFVGGFLDKSRVGLAKAFGQKSPAMHHAAVGHLANRSLAHASAVS